MPTGKVARAIFEREGCRSPCRVSNLEEADDHRARFLNPDRIAIIEVPADLYHRLSAPEDI